MEAYENAGNDCEIGRKEMRVKGVDNVSKKEQYNYYNEKMKKKTKSKSARKINKLRLYKADPKTYRRRRGCSRRPRL